MNKICTSIEQSKKLIELGINVSTADMLWTYDFVANDINGLNIISGNFKPEENDIPAWSLSALMELMNRNYYNISLNCNGAEWTVKFDDSEIYHYITCDYSIDAAFEMVVWLKKNRKI